MSLNTHARCDQCEAILIAVDEDEMVAEGWMVVRFGLADVRQDFCCLPCLKRWSGSDAARAAVVRASAVEEGE